MAAEKSRAVRSPFEAAVRNPMNPKLRIFLGFGLIAIAASLLASCGGGGKVEAKDPADTSSTEVSVGVVKIGRKNLGRTLTLSSELVPYQETDVYAKESGYVKDLNVDYGSRVQKDQVLATLEIPELQAQLKQDDAAIKNASDQITHAQNEVSRIEATHNALQLQFDRLNGVAKSKPGLVAQQEVDDSEGRALSSAAQVEVREIEPGSPPKASSRQLRPSGNMTRYCSITPRSQRRFRASSLSVSPILGRWCRQVPAQVRRPCRWSVFQRTIDSAW